MAEKTVKKENVEKETKKKETKKPETKPKKADKKSTIYDKDNIIIASSLTEKSINMVDLNNTLVFLVKRTARKQQIKKIIEEMFDVKVKSVRTLQPLKKYKKAYITLDPEYSASDIATKIGMM